MAVDQQDRDSYTGYLTTGHEWNGIKELNTPVPRVVYFFLMLAFLFSVGYWVLMPAWPLGVTYTKGLLGIDQRNAVAASLREAAADRSVWAKKIETESFAAVQSDPKMMAIVREDGPRGADGLGDRAQLRTRSDAPTANRVIEAARVHGLSVRREHRGGDRISVASDQRLFLASDGVPGAQR